MPSTATPKARASEVTRALTTWPARNTEVGTGVLRSRLRTPRSRSWTKVLARFWNAADTTPITITDAVMTVATSIVPG